MGTGLSLDAIQAKQPDYTVFVTFPLPMVIQQVIHGYLTTEEHLTWIINLKSVKVDVWLAWLRWHNYSCYDKLRTLVNYPVSRSHNSLTAAINIVFRERIWDTLTQTFLLCCATELVPDWIRYLRKDDLLNRHLMQTHFRTSLRRPKYYLDED